MKENKEEAKVSSIQRFLDIQKENYEIALEEIKKGRKVSCWMWYIFPQMIGLGRSHICKYYGIKNIEEGIEYLKNEELRHNLLEISQALLDLGDVNITRVMGVIDDDKLKSSMTLFNIVEEKSGIDCKKIFQKVLHQFFNDEKDENTLKILEYQEKKKEEYKELIKKKDKDKIKDSDNQNLKEDYDEENKNNKDKNIEDKKDIKDESDKEKERKNGETKMTDKKDVFKTLENNKEFKNENQEEIPNKNNKDPTENHIVNENRNNSKVNNNETKENNVIKGNKNNSKVNNNVPIENHVNNENNNNSKVNNKEPKGNHIIKENNNNSKINNNEKKDIQSIGNYEINKKDNKNKENSTSEKEIKDNSHEIDLIEEKNSPGTNKKLNIKFEKENNKLGKCCQDFCIIL